MLFLQWTTLHVKAFMEVIPNALDSSHVSHPLCLGNMKLLLKRYTCSLNLLVLFYLILFYLFIYFTHVIGQNELTPCDELID